MLDSMGWLGGVLLALCGLPQAIECIKTKSANGLNWLFLLTWLFGEIMLLIYIWPKKDYPLLINYLFNLVFVGIMVFYKLKSRK